MTPATVSLDVEGTPVEARLGETVAAALTRAGLRTLRRPADGSGRGVFCGMGVCQECVVELDGARQRACMVRVTGPHRIGGEGGGEGGLAPSRPPIGLDDIPVLTPDVLVVGGGAAGLAAASAAAEAGAAVVLLDERSRPGGQYYKQPAPGGAGFDDPQFAAGRALIARAERAGVQVRCDAAVVAAVPARDLLVSHPGGVALYRPAALVVATGAYERVPPFPGWTLPGVMTTGAAQSLLRGEGVVAGRRVLVCGHGPLGLQVAVELARRGAAVAAVAELAPRPEWRHAGALWRMASSTPGLLLQGLRLRARAGRSGIEVLHGRTLRSVRQGADGLRAELDSGQTFDVDVVCVGYGFEPANEILRALDCRHRFDPGRGHLAAVRDESCATSVEGVFAAGDCCGTGGARAAVAEGGVAGAAAAAHAGHSATAAAARRRLRRDRRFQAGLWRLYAGHVPPDALATAETVVCRCELVTLGAIRAALDEGEATLAAVKRRTRAGMGPCQGRYCGAVVAVLAARHSGHSLDEFAFSAPRAPIMPVALGSLGRPLGAAP